MGTIFTDWLKTNAQTVRASELGADAVSAWIAWMQEAIPDKANVQVAGMQQAFRYGLLPGKGLSVSIKEGLNTVAEKITKEQLPGASTQTLAIANLGELTGGNFHGGIFQGVPREVPGELAQARPERPEMLLARVYRIPGKR
jgi:hypothetical protein